MNTQILRKAKESLTQRMRILILQNAREGTVYDEEFLKEVHLVSEQLLKLSNVSMCYEHGRETSRVVAMIPSLVAEK